MEAGWPCVECGVDMGPGNPRQLCGKWRCLSPPPVVTAPLGVQREDLPEGVTVLRFGESSWDSSPPEPVPAVCIAGFDFDHTLTRPRNGKLFSKDAEDWEWTSPAIPEILRAYCQTHRVVVFTNQTWTNPEKAEMKIRQLTESLGSLQLPLLVVAARDKERRKPSPWMWQWVTGERAWSREGSFFVGDAGGRPGEWADSDRAFAEAVGVRFLYPQEIFGGAPAAGTTQDPRAVVAAVAAAVAALPQYEGPQEIILLVGFPGSGKSTVAAALAKRWSTHQVVSGDALKTPAKIRTAARAILQAGGSPVIDATNGTVERRAEMIALAREHRTDVGVRCLWVRTELEESVRRDAQRAMNTGVKPIPRVAFYTYRKRFVPPCSAEGYWAVEVID